MLTNLTIRKKMFASAVVTFVLTAILGYYGLSSNATFKDRFDDAVDKTVRKVVLAGTIAEEQSTLVSAQRGTVLGAEAKDATEIQTTEQQFQNSSEQIHKALEEIRPLLTNEEAKALTANIEAKLAEWRPHHEDLMRAAQSGRASEANHIRKDITGPIYKDIAGNAKRLRPTSTITTIE